MESSDKKVQYLAVFSISFAVLHSSSVISWTTPVIPKFHNNETSINITDNEISWILAINAPGLMAGSVVSGYAADIVGRRATLLASALPFLIGTIFVIVATKAWILYIARFLWGCGTGMLVSVSLIYIVEIADSDIRGKLTVGSRFIFNVGSFFILVIGSLVSDHTLSYMLLGICVCHIVACWWVPETPYYLLKEGKVNTARKELMKLSGCIDEKMLDERLSLMRSQVRNEMRLSGTVKELFVGKRYRKAILIAVGLKIWQILSGSTAIQQYVGRIMQDSKSGISVLNALIVFGTVRVVVGLMSSVIIDRVGRRPLMILTFLGGSVSLGVVGLVFYLQEVISVDEESSRLHGYIIFIGIICNTIFSTVGYDTLTFIVPAEIFPLNVKSIAMTFLSVFSSTCVFITLKGYQVVKDLSGLYGVFGFFSFATLLGAIFTYFAVPETKGKSLREIQIELQSDHYDDDSDLQEKLEKTVEANRIKFDDLEEREEIAKLNDNKSAN